MLNLNARAAVKRAMTPIARRLLRLGVRPDAVTAVGTLGASAAALWFFPRGVFFLGAVLVTIFVLSDMLDGTMARLGGRSTRWGAFLDSTLDRIADAAILSGIVLWYAGRGDDLLLAGVALFGLVSGLLVSYSKARAEGLGMTAEVGVAERTERLVIALVGIGLSGLGVPYILEIALWLLAALAAVTVVQRMVAVRRQAVAPIEEEPR
jgi:CDP-diacylglycerol--glycerol-3-phosphate 3-phosphatidyltransferase